MALIDYSICLAVYNDSRRLKDGPLMMATFGLILFQHFSCINICVCKDKVHAGIFKLAFQLLKLYKTSD